MKSSGIGGQAVLEGVMMKNKQKYAVAVRKPNGKIVVTKGDCKSVAEKSVFFRLPIIRGVVAFVESLVLGMKTLTYSSSLYEEEEKTSKGKKNETITKEYDMNSVSTKETVENVVIVILSIIMAVAFFMLLPLFLSELLHSRIKSDTLLVVIEGVLRIVLFIGYVFAISCMKDIKRVFMYHGAEHKTINCVEKGLNLNVANVKKQSCEHRRCGTSFMLVVMFLSVIFFMFIIIKNIWLRMLFRILLVPVIAGVSFEFIRWAGNTENKVVIALSKPGLLLQKLTTREPDDAMIEVAIQSVEAVFDWREYQRISKARAKVQKKTPKSGKKTRAQIRQELKEREGAYRNRVQERKRLAQEQEEKEAKLEQKFKEAQERVKQRCQAATLESESEDGLDGLDHFFDGSSQEKESKPSCDDKMIGDEEIR